ncbi:MAG: DNA topoisomerase IV subunit A [Aestuariivita sp.]|nr:DNA topoisomerase IV subunit A [Aestuariivita sp.]
MVMIDFHDDSDDAQRSFVEPLRRAIGDRYLTYALSTIMHRALPDVRDGLKPVHRRILYAMRELRLDSQGGFRKSAKISGDVMGNFHPHGDAAIYDAMARLAQDFNVRYPLVDGQGNFGNIDGDNPAASRYTEARLTVIAEAMLEGLNENAVDFRENYDGSLMEPVVLPAQFPNLLANGASGIAVGMATNIPPHNIAELCDACLHLVKTPDAREGTLLKFVQGPDFPTGGIIVDDPAVIAEAYSTGRGSFRVRCRWELEKLHHGQWQIVVTEIPYQVQKSKLIEKIAALIQGKKIPVLADVRDESTDDIRLILEPKSKNVPPDVLMDMLYRMSDLEVRFSLNLNVLIDGLTPKVCSLKEVLREFLEFRRDILIRRSQHRLLKINDRLELIEGFLVVFNNLDRVIEIIRYDDNPKAALMREDWRTEYPRATSEHDYVSPGAGEGSLNENQVDGILNLRLRSLRRLEEMELRREEDALMEENAALEDLLNVEQKQWEKIADQIKETKKNFGKSYAGGLRRTSFEEVGDEESLDMVFEGDPITVVCSQKGWVRTMAGHIDTGRELKFKDGDGPCFLIHAKTSDKLLLFGTNGRFYSLSVANLPGGRGMGEPIRLMVDLPNEADIADLFVYNANERLIVASAMGNGFMIGTDDVVAQTRSGKQVLNLSDGDQAVVSARVDGDHVAIVSTSGVFLVFPVSDVPEMTRGKGVRLQKYPKSSTSKGQLRFQEVADGGLSDLMTFHWNKGIKWTMGGGKERHERDLSHWLGTRGHVGKRPPHGFPSSNTFK